MNSIFSGRDCAQNFLNRLHKEKWSLHSIDTAQRKKAQSENSVIHLSGIWASPLGTNHYRRGGGLGFGGSYGFHRGRRGISLRQQSIKRDYRKLTANYLPVRRGKEKYYKALDGESAKFCDTPKSSSSRTIDYDRFPWLLGYIKELLKRWHNTISVHRHTNRKESLNNLASWNGFLAASQTLNVISCTKLGVSRATQPMNQIDCYGRGFWIKVTI